MMMRKMMMGAAAISMGGLGACDSASNPSDTSAAFDESSNLTLTFAWKFPFVFCRAVM